MNENLNLATNLVNEFNALNASFLERWKVELTKTGYQIAISYRSVDLADAHPYMTMYVPAPFDQCLEKLNILREQESRANRVTDASFSFAKELEELVKKYVKINADRGLTDEFDEFLSNCDIRDYAE